MEEHSSDRAVIRIERDRDIVIAIAGHIACPRLHSFDDPVRGVANLDWRSTAAAAIDKSAPLVLSFDCNGTGRCPVDGIDAHDLAWDVPKGNLEVHASETGKANQPGLCEGDWKASS